MQDKPNRRPGGIICPLAVPLSEPETLDVPALHKLIGNILPDVDAIFLLGSTGEFAFLTDSLADQILDEAIGYIDGRVSVFVGVSDTGTSRAEKNLIRANRAGVDYAVATSPFYYPVQNQVRLLEHFTSLAEASPRPIVIYNIPQNTGINLSPDTVQRLSDHPNIAGIKDSWGDMIQFQEFLQAKDEGFSVMQGREQLAAVSFWLGADGLVSALTNFAPKMLHRILAAVQKNDREAALAAQRDVSRLAQVFDQGYWVSGLKATLRELGIGNGTVSRPFDTCSPDQVKTIRQLLLEANLYPSKEYSNGK